MMKRSQRGIRLGVGVFLLLLIGCLFAGCAAEKPPGPAERLGRTIDQLTEDLQDISEELDKNRSEKERHAAQERERYEDEKRDDARREYDRYGQERRRLDDGTYYDRDSARYRSPSPDPDYHDY